MHAQVQKPTVYTSALRLWGNPPHRRMVDQAAGGTSVTNDGRSTENTTFTLEQLLAWDPDILFSMPQATATSLPRRAVPEAQAVANKHVYLIPVGRTCGPTALSNNR